MTRRVENLAVARNATVIDATGRVVMPAFVDSGVSMIHAHTAIERNDERLTGNVPQNPGMQRNDILDAVRALSMVSKKGLILEGGPDCGVFCPAWNGHRRRGFRFRPRCDGRDQDPAST